ncbi:MAG: imidazolonepropionase [Bacteriovoracaceae bacterium]|nr:imidazolonepropionase [Bacteriovoracaceae bacterium]
MKTWRNFSQLVTMENAWKKDGRNLDPADLSIIKNGSIVFDDEKIHWVGPDCDFPTEYREVKAEYFRKKVLIPEMVDCHTHVVFGGDRAQEYSMRLNGADYEQIAIAGGGILNSMNGTNDKSKDELFNESVEKIKRIHSYGVGTVEVKSGYGLNFDKEHEISHVIHDLKKHFEGRVQIKNTFMAAHAVPAEYKSSSEFMEEVVIPLLERLAPKKIIDAVDIFHERNYFDEKDTELIFEKAKEFNIPVKSHADEFADNKGAILATKYGALSTDHLLMTGDDGIKALAESNTVATLLPGTGFFLGKPQANARKFLDAGCKVAIGSDYNPGSCHCDNVLLIASIAAPQYKMNISELWASITLNAAHALNMKDQGAITPGLKPRFTIFDVPTIDHVTYHWGRNLLFDEVPCDYLSSGR